MGQFGPSVQRITLVFVLVALAAVGLQGHWRAFTGAGACPVLLGLVTWIVVALASLAIQTWTNTL